MGIVGTPTYMSPEQARGARDVDFRTDIYSLGATLYHMALGDLPFPASTPQETVVRVVAEAPRPPRAVFPDLSEPAAAVICRMMAKDAADRHASYAELKADLAAARDGKPVSISYEEACGCSLAGRPGRRKSAQPGSRRRACFGRSPSPARWPASAWRCSC